MDLELLPMMVGGYGGAGRVHIKGSGRGERAIERLTRAMGLMMLLLGGMIVLRVLGDVWVGEEELGGERGGLVGGNGSSRRGSLVVF